MSIRAVIGKNFGDEGKGLATDYFSMLAEKGGNPCLVIRHNGGAQAGHTVDLKDNRFVFHQLSSGSFRSADTYWADTFLPDMYKLREEADAFKNLGKNTTVRIYGNRDCNCVYIDDVLVNMALESARGADRHGSCGMGINEAVERSAKDGLSLTLYDVCPMSAQSLYNKLCEIRREHIGIRLEELKLSLTDLGEYGELLSSPHVLYNAAEEMCRGAELVTPCDDLVAQNYDDIIFEGAQGLLLDQNYTKYAPHLTTSNTGVKNSLEFVRRNFPSEVPEIIYVSRTYVTRHGAGPLPLEGEFDRLAFDIQDKTNVFNEWQGNLRYAPHGTCGDFLADIKADLGQVQIPVKVSLMLTHLNETNRKIISKDSRVDLKSWFEAECMRDFFEKIYLSDSKYAQDIVLYNKFDS